MVHSRVSVPPGVERIFDSWSIVLSVFLKYIGSQLWRVWAEGTLGGVDAGPSGAATSFVLDMFIRETDLEAQRF